MSESIYDKFIRVIGDPGGYTIVGIMLYPIAIIITIIILQFFRRNEEDKNLPNGIENLSLKGQIAHMGYLFSTKCPSKCKMANYVIVLYLVLSYYIVLKIVTTLSYNKFMLSYTDIILGVVIYLFILFITYNILNNITITEEEKKAPNGIENLSLKGQLLHIWYLFNKSNLLKILTIHILLVYYIIILCVPYMIRYYL